MTASDPALISTDAKESSARKWYHRVYTAVEHHVLAWMDQALVSAGSFISIILIGRWASGAELGAYSIGLSLVALLLAVQDALITRPYSIQMDGLPGSPPQRTFTALLFSLGLSIAAIVLLIAGTAWLPVFQPAELHWMGWALAVVLPFIAIREFARRAGFAHFAIGRVLVLDAIAVGLGLAAFLLLGLEGELSAATAVIAVGTSCAVALVWWLWRTRGEFAFEKTIIKPTLVKSWGLGKWLLVTQVAQQIQGYAPYWLTMITASTVVTGQYAICMSIIAFVNPALFGFYNVLVPRTVRALKLGGFAGLRRETMKASLLVAGITAAFLLVIAVAGDTVLHLLYPKIDYADYGTILVILAGSVLMASIGVPPAISLASAGHGRSAAFVTIASACACVVLVYTLLISWGLIGAAIAVLLTEAGGALARWVTFLSRTNGNEAPISISAPEQVS